MLSLLMPNLHGAWAHEWRMIVCMHESVHGEQCGESRLAMATGSNQPRLCSLLVVRVNSLLQDMYTMLSIPCLFATTVHS